MRTFLVLFILLLTTFGCGKFILVGDPELLSIYFDFIERCEEYNTPCGVVSEFRYVEPGVLNQIRSEDSGHPVFGPIGAVCRWYFSRSQSDNSRIVFVSNEIKDPHLLRQVVWHELGHCALSKEHDGTDSYTLMMENIAEFSFVERFGEDVWEILVEDFFTRNAPTNKINFLGL